MKRVKYLQCLSGTDYCLNVNDVNVIDDAAAERLVANGAAEILEDIPGPPASPTPAAAEPAAGQNPEPPGGVPAGEPGPAPAASAAGPKRNRRE